MDIHALYGNFCHSINSCEGFIDSDCSLLYLVYFKTKNIEEKYVNCEFNRRRKRMEKFGAALLPDFLNILLNGE